VARECAAQVVQIDSMLDACLRRRTGWASHGFHELLDKTVSVRALLLFGRGFFI